MVGLLEEKLLYAYDALLYLADVTLFLPTALQILDVFGLCSGIKINWGKFLLFPLHPVHPKPLTGTLLSWVEFKYLGIKVGA